MKIRTIIAASCAALAFSMAGPIYAHVLAVFVLDTNDNPLTTPIK